MNSRIDLNKIARKALYHIAIILIANSLGSLDLWHTAICWAGATITVNPGDSLQTLVNENPTSTTFSLAPGIHRLQSVVPKSHDSFVGQAGAILSGAALLTDFTQNGPYWISHAQVSKAASYPGTCDSTHPACLFPEDLFFDNVPKSRVMSLSAVEPGSWYLDYSTGNVYMGDDPYGHTVEISLLGYAFTGGAASVTISNLVVEKYACVADNGAIHGGDGTVYWDVGGNEVRYNHCIGIRSGDGMFIHNNNVHNNGQMGIGGTGSAVLVQSNEISFNNYSGYSYYWESGGAKFARVEHLTFRYNYSHDNGGPGFWTDINSQDVLCDQNEFARNKEAGVLIEASNTVTVSNNYIWNDGFNYDGTSIWWGAGILISTSSYVSVYFNRLINCMNGIGGILANRGNAPNGQPYSLQNDEVNNNTITQDTGMAAGIVEESGFENSVYTSWNNHFLSNTFILANPAGDYFYWLGQPMTLASWDSSDATE